MLLFSQKVENKHVCFKKETHFLDDNFINKITIDLKKVATIL